MTRINWPATLATGLLALTLAPLGVTLPRAEAQATRTTYDFEDGLQGFSTLLVKAGQFGMDAEGSLTVVKDVVHGGKGALTYTYKPEKVSVRAIVAGVSFPEATQSISLWVRSNTRTQLVLSLREDDETAYDFPFYVPAHEWTQVRANLDEFRLGNNSTDENNKLDISQVHSLALVDIASVLVNIPDLPLVSDFNSQRQVWLDDVQFSTMPAPRAMGEVKAGDQKALLLNNFESGVVDWIAARVTLEANAPRFELFPETVSMRVLPEAAGPGGNKTPLEPGGKGLRISYKRSGQDAFAFVRSVERQDLRAADRLRLSVNLSQKSLLIVQVKERDDSEYQYVILPDNSTGWQNVDVPLSALTLAENSKDENNHLDPDQIKELTLVDASAFAGLGPDDVTLDLDAVYFTLH